mmetsp:Transcript_11748/g.26356  ORF Transcript_11748/g.26356 Transcript_11748/m.26356 type:complete len:207 (-) Transcript_11748:16-636(-)
MLYPSSPSLPRGSSGVLPPPSRLLAIFGMAGATEHSADISSSLSSASTKSASAPASAKHCALSSASLKPTACLASLRANTMIGSWPVMAATSSRASHAARMRATASSLFTTRFGPTCPQLLGHSWSSIRIPANPSLAYSETVLWQLTPLPYPVSASTMIGKSPAASMMLRDWSITSPKLNKPTSGLANLPAATLKPETKATSNKPD